MRQIPHSCGSRRSCRGVVVVGDLFLLLASFWTFLGWLTFGGLEREGGEWATARVAGLLRWEVFGVAARASVDHRSGLQSGDDGRGLSGTETAIRKGEDDTDEDLLAFGDGQRGFDGDGRRGRVKANLLDDMGESVGASVVIDGLVLGPGDIDEHSVSEGVGPRVESVVSNEKGISSSVEIDERDRGEGCSSVDARGGSDEWETSVKARKLGADVSLERSEEDLASELARPGKVGSEGSPAGPIVGGEVFNPVEDDEGEGAADEVLGRSMRVDWLGFGAEGHPGSSGQKGQSTN